MKAKRISRWLPSLDRFQAQWPKQVLTLFVLALGLCVIEVFGRQSANDVEDLFWLCTLSLLLIFVKSRDDRWNLGWGNLWQQPRRLLHAFVSHFELELGADLRGTPAVPRKCPASLVAVSGVISLVTFALIPLAYWLPGSLRAAMLQGSYTVYLVLLSAFWMAIVLNVVVMGFFSWAYLHDRFAGRFHKRGQRSLRPELMTGYVIVGVLLLAAWLVPVWIPASLMAAWVIVTAVAIVMPSNPELTLLWRTEKLAPRVFSLNFRLWVSLWSLPLMLTPCLLVLLACGKELTPPYIFSFSMPITSVLGSVLAWVSVTGLGACALTLIRTMMLGRYYSPHRRILPVLHVQGTKTEAERKTITNQMKELGWNTRFAPKAAKPLDVCVVLSDAPLSAMEEAQWPLPISIASLSDPDIQFRLARRYEIQIRRQMVNGLERLFKQAARQNFQRGEGFWVALHYWFMLGLTRDQQEEFTSNRDSTIIDETIGPPYYKVFSRAVRQHALKIMQALEVDLIFVEDGVTFRRFRNVLRSCFELYDVHGGEVRAEEKHFSGLPGIRVMIHDVELGGEQDTEDYPEPDYKEIARARILHVYKDRDEDPVDEVDPVDIEDLPLLSGM